MLRESPRPWRPENAILVHGLLRCTTCNRYWNQDFNSALNIHMLAKMSPERPISLTRGGDSITHDTTSEEDTSVDPSN